MTIESSHRVVLIRIPQLYRPRMTEDELYEATRKWWKVNPDRHGAEFAFAVVDGAVEAVYRIDDWETEPTRGRWGFRGVRDHDMQRRYAGTDVTEYLPRGAQNPIRYVNC